MKINLKEEHSSDEALFCERVAFDIKFYVKKIHRIKFYELVIVQNKFGAIILEESGFKQIYRHHYRCRTH